MLNLLRLHTVVFAGTFACAWRGWCIGSPPTGGDVHRAEGGRGSRPVRTGRRWSWGWGPSRQLKGVEGAGKLEPVGELGLVRGLHAGGLWGRGRVRVPRPVHAQGHATRAQRSHDTHLEAKGLP